MFIAMCTPTTSDGIPTNSALSAGWLESHAMDNKLQLQVDIVVVKNYHRLNILRAYLYKPALVDDLNFWI